MYVGEKISHVVVEELLELLVDKVDGDLFKPVVLKDLKSSNVKHSTEVGLLHGGVYESFDNDQGTDDKQLLTNKSVVTLDDQPLEDAIKDGTSDTAGGSSSLVAVGEQD